MMTYTAELELALSLARQAGEVVLGFYGGPLHIEDKSDDHVSEPVTQADRLANELIVTAVHEAFPDDGMLAEESVDTEHRLEKRRVWMVDPLDGTTGFIEGNGDFAVQIGLAEEGESVMGVVYLPLSGRTYYAARGLGSWISGPGEEPKRAEVSRAEDVHDMTLAASRSHRSPRMDRVVKSFGFRREVRRGSVGIKIGLIVETSCDLYIHLSPRTKQWDTCAPQVILHEAGGLLTDVFGQPLLYNVSEVQNLNGLVATNRVAHPRIVEGLAPLLQEFGRVPR